MNEPNWKLVFAIVMTNFVLKKNKGNQNYKTFLVNICCKYKNINTIFIILYKIYKYCLLNNIVFFFVNAFIKSL